MSLQMTRATPWRVGRGSDRERTTAPGPNVRPDADVHRYVGTWSIQECEEMDVEQDDE